MPAPSPRLMPARPGRQIAGNPGHPAAAANQNRSRSAPRQRKSPAPASMTSASPLLNQFGGGQNGHCAGGAGGGYPWPTGPRAPICRAHKSAAPARIHESATAHNAAYFRVATRVRNFSVPAIPPTVAPSITPTRARRSLPCQLSPCATQPAPGQRLARSDPRQLV